MFSDAEIRYCLAQIIRIEAVRPLVDRYERAQVAYFNELVADYNSRCGHYRYMEGARESAQVQVEISRSTIESDARQAYLWRFAESEKSSAPSRSPATAQTPVQDAKKPPKSAAAAQADAAAAQPSRPAPPKRQPATPARTEPAQSALPQAQAKQPVEPPPATPPATSQPERSAAPPSQTTAPQQAAAITSESAQPVAAQPQAKPPPTEAAASAPPASPQPERSAAPPSQTTAQQVPAIASAQDTRAAEAPASARAVEQAPPPAATPEASSQAKSKPTSVASARTDGVPAAAVERFTREVERTGSQVLDQSNYPSEARDKNWEGTTLIEVRYAQGGYIRSIVVGQSCGHPVLDEQAVQIARNLRLPNAPEELRSHEFAVRFPIVFKLSKR
jgi:TonB family protein